jgi:uncharacterized protein (UPF0335 family)
LKADLDVAGLKAQVLERIDTLEEREREREELLAEVTAMAEEHGFDARRLRRWWAARSSSLSGILNLYTVAQNVVSTSMFPDAVGDLELPIGAGLCRVVDTASENFPSRQ